MADDKENQDDEKVEKNTASEQSSAKIGIVTWAILTVIVVSCSGSGFVLGRLFAGGSATETSGNSQEVTQTEEVIQNDPETDPKETWYYNELESVVVNPQEPGATRYVRVGLILEVSSELTEEEANELFKTKKPLLINWLNIYFKSLTLDEMSSDRDMQRILSQICDAFNEILFPDAKPQIKRILVREFNIQ